MIYKNIKLILILFIALIQQSNAQSGALITDKCEVKSQFYECMEANGMDKNGVNTGSLPMNRMIDEYVCISDKDNVKILENIILDMEFKKVEEWMDKFLNSLANSKEYYFTKGSINNEITGIADIEAIFGNKFSDTKILGYKYGEFYKQFNYLCNGNGIFNLMMECKGHIPNIKAITTIQKSGKIENTNECMRLAETKLAIYENIAQNLLKINKGKVKEDNVDKYNKELNGMYDDLFGMFIVNVDYIWAVLNNWVSKTRKCFGG